MRLFPLPELEDKKEYPSFYAIIPAYVRYNKSLSPSAKLLFGEITALTNKHGYCYASNKYFANVFDVDKSSITHWVKQLIDTGCIMQELIYAKDKPIIEERRIYVTIPLLPSSNIPNQEDLPETKAVIDGLVQGSMHNDPQNMDNYAFPNEGGEIIHQGGENSHHGVVKNFNGGGEISPERILQANNIKAAAADQSSQNNEKPPPENAATAFSDVSKEAVDKLKFHLAGFDKNILFDASFYPKILSFLSDHNLTFEYITWMYNLCFQKNPKNLCGYLFRILLEPRYVELYREAAREIPEKTFDCPVCGRVLSSQVLSCPECGFDNTVNHDRESIREARLLYSMPSDVKKAYEEELNELSTASPSSMGIFEFGRKVRDLKQKYGLLQAD